MNSVNIVGRLSKEVELRYTPNQIPVATGTIAVNRQFKNAQGETEADFINFVIWRKPAENTANFTTKGSLVGITGRWQTRNFEGQDGKRVYINECLVESIQFLDRKKEENGNTGSYQQNTQSNVDNGDPFANSGNIDISDDVLPF